MKRKIELIFILVFMLSMVLPFLLAHRATDRISYQENRLFANFPDFRTEDGRLNQNFAAEFDAWIDDNIRFRTTLTGINTRIQYAIFNRIAKEDEYIGREDIIFSIPNDKISLFRSPGRLTDDKLTAYSQKMQELNDYLTGQKIAFYYMQCYEKESVYPEYFVPGILIGNLPEEAQKVVGALKEKTNVTLIPVYESLMEEKPLSRLYYKVKDPSHWNEKGAFCGFQALMDTLNKDFPDLRKVSEQDYLIKTEQDLRDIYGFTYPYPEDSLTYSLRDAKAAEYNLAEESPDFYERILFKEHTHLYRNESAGNNYRILLLGDSYIRQFIKDDIAEHFKETLSIDWMNIPRIREITAVYQPDIVILESAESFLGNTVDLVQQWDSE